jgi:hypothetical protein
MEAGLPFWIVIGRAHEHADATHALALLPARRERPSGYTAAEKRDEFPPPHGAYPKDKDHELIIAPCIAAKSGHCVSHSPRPTGVSWLQSS